MFINIIFCVRTIFSYWWHSVNGISYGLAQSDPIKRHPLYAHYLFFRPYQLSLKKCLNIEMRFERTDSSCRRCLPLRRSSRPEVFWLLPVGPKGPSISRSCWTSIIFCNRVKIILGSFITWMTRRASDLWNTLNRNQKGKLQSVEMYLQFPKDAKLFAKAMLKNSSICCCSSRLFYISS